MSGVRSLTRRATPQVGYASAASAPVRVDSTTNTIFYNGTGSGTTEIELVDVSTAQTISGVKTYTGISQGTLVTTLGASFVEDATTLTHTATFVLPINAILLDILFLSTVLWTGGGTVQFTCGDVNSANGYFVATNLKATDLLVGERLQASNANNWGGLNGAYITTAGRFGQQSTQNIGGFQNVAGSVIMVVTESAPSTTAGRSFGWVTYAVSTTNVVPVKV